MINPGAQTAGPWWQRAMDLLLPPRCVHCGLRGSEICDACLKLMRPLATNVCPRCNAPWVEGRVCRRCAEHPLVMRALIAAFPFEGPARSALLAMKYGGRTRLVRYLVQGLELALERRPLTIDLVIPVPLSSGRLRSRGFNQSELLARPVADHHQWALAPRTLARIRDTPQQTRLPAARRSQNVAEAFAVLDPGGVKGKRILLVDDVATTGATLNACAAALLSAGAEGVWGLVVARDV